MGHSSYCNHGIMKSHDPLVHRKNMSTLIKEALSKPEARTSDALAHKAADQQTFLPWND